jgi:hypothetical protein
MYYSTKGKIILPIFTIFYQYQDDSTSFFHEHVFCAQRVDNTVDMYRFPHRKERSFVSEDRYFLIYQEANEEECLLTVQPFDDVESLAEAINRLEGQNINDYTLIKGRKMKATLKVAVDLTELEDETDT